MSKSDEADDLFGELQGSGRPSEEESENAPQDIPVFSQDDDDEITEIEPEQETISANSEGLTVQDARERLIELRENVIYAENPNADRSGGILRKNMLLAFLKYRPTSKEEFLAKIPTELRQKTEGGEMKYIEDIFAILAQIED